MSNNSESLEHAYKEDIKREQLARKEVETERKIIIEDLQGKEIVINKNKCNPRFEKAEDPIELAKWAWNPVTGCLGGCPYCYAREIAENSGYKHAFPAGFSPVFRPDRLEAPQYSLPLIDKKDPLSKRVFVCSMADLFGLWVPSKWIESVIKAASKNKEFEYLFLTKNPMKYTYFNFLRNCWLGATVTKQSEVCYAMEAFRKIDDNAFTGVRWISFEPLLEPINIDLRHIDLIVIGAQTATNQKDGKVPAVAPKFEWVMDLMNQADSVGCPIFMKQNLLLDESKGHPGMVPIQEIPERLKPNSSSINL